MPSVLVTGASRGIGRAAALRLAEAGWDVVAGVRDLAAAPEHARIAAVLLDVTDEAQVAALDQALPVTLDAVVNNAGIAVIGPVEAVPVGELRRQLEVNVVGQVAVTRAVLPRLRSSRGRIVFVSSVSGRVATPMTGVYNASKFALEGMADALRMELAPWAVRVSLVEPVQTDTDIWRNATSDFDASVATFDAAHRELYAKHIAGHRKGIPRSQKLAAPAEVVVAAIERALTDRRPKARYLPGRPAAVQARLAGLMPTSLLDVVLRSASGVPRKL